MAGCPFASSFNCSLVCACVCVCRFFCLSNGLSVHFYSSCVVCLLLFSVYMYVESFAARVAGSGAMTLDGTLMLRGMRRWWCCFILCCILSLLLLLLFLSCFFSFSYVLWKVRKCCICMDRPLPSLPPPNPSIRQRKKCPCEQENGGDIDFLYCAVRHKIKCLLIRWKKKILSSQSVKLKATFYGIFIKI